VLTFAWSERVLAQASPGPSPISKACEGAAAGFTSGSPLPNIAAALKGRKKITILAIGSTSASSRGPVSGGQYAVVERFLETSFKGLDVDIVHRGVSGELAADAAERIKMEVALTGADLVLWQLGTADALAQIPLEDFQAVVARTIDWLKEHKVDLILVGLRYARNMSRDPTYQAIRTTVHDLAKQKNVLRISRYEAEETFEKVRQEQGLSTAWTEATEFENSCLAEYLARAIAAGLFLRDSPPQ
jgi:lysophospholipase L1-like esterase